MNSLFPSQHGAHDVDARQTLHDSLVAIEAAVATLAKVGDPDERADMARTVQLELQAVRTLMHQLDAEHADADVPLPRSH